MSHSRPIISANQHHSPFISVLFYFFWNFMHDLFFAVCQCQKQFSTMPIKMHKYPFDIFPNPDFRPTRLCNEFDEKLNKTLNNREHWTMQNAMRRLVPNGWVKVHSVDDSLYIHLRGRIFTLHYTLPYFWASDELVGKVCLQAVASKHYK